MDEVARMTMRLWPHVGRLLPPVHRSPKGGRPRCPDIRCLGGIVWVLSTGARWGDLPQPRFPSGSTCWRRMRDWSDMGLWKRIHVRILRLLKRRRRLATDEVFIDASFVSAKHGGYGIGKTKVGKGCKIELVVNRDGVPLAVTVAPASAAEVNLAEPVLTGVAGRCGKSVPVIGDRIYDCDPLRRRLLSRRWILLSPHRRNRKRAKTNDGRRMRRYRRRYRIERTNAWMDHFHRTVVRWEFYNLIFEGFVRLSCIFIALWRF